LSHKEFNQKEFSIPSLGESIAFNSGVGFMFHKNFGMEMNVAYLEGLQIDLYNFKSTNYTVNANTKNRQVLLLPTTVFRVSMKKFTPYVKVGIIIPMINQSDFKYSLISNSNTQNRNEYEYKLSNELNLGINGCVGIGYAISNQLEIFFEAEEDNIRSFHKTAYLNNKSENTAITPQSALQNSYTFVSSSKLPSTNNSDIQNFPISFNREAYTIGLRIKIY
jgi:hypothetical protein